MFIDLTPSIESGARNPGCPLCAALQGCVARAFRVESATGGERPAQTYLFKRRSDLAGLTTRSGIPA